MWVPDCHLQTGTRLRVATHLYLHTGPMTTALLRVDRPFNWGIVILTDESSNDPINQIPTGSTPVVIDSTGATIAVRHAQDVDDLDDEPVAVTVEVILGAATQPPTLGGTITIPTGALLVGDAEHFDVASLVPGDYRIAVLAVPAESAQHITIWLSPRT